MHALEKENAIKVSLPRWKRTTPWRWLSDLSAEREGKRLAPLMNTQLLKIDKGAAWMGGGAGERGGMEDRQGETKRGVARYTGRLFALLLQGVQR